MDYANMFREAMEFQSKGHENPFELFFGSIKDILEVLGMEDVRGLMKSMSKYLKQVTHEDRGHDSEERNELFKRLSALDEVFKKMTPKHWEKMWSTFLKNDELEQSKRELKRLQLQLKESAAYAAKTIEEQASEVAALQSEVGKLRTVTSAIPDIYINIAKERAATGAVKRLRPVLRTEGMEEQGPLLERLPDKIREGFKEGMEVSFFSEERLRLKRLQWLAKEAHEHLPKELSKEEAEALLKGFKKDEQEKAILLQFCAHHLPLSVMGELLAKRSDKELLERFEPYLKEDSFTEALRQLAPEHLSRVRNEHIMYQAMRLLDDARYHGNTYDALVKAFEAKGETIADNITLAEEKDGERFFQRCIEVLGEQELLQLLIKEEPDFFFDRVRNDPEVMNMHLAYLRTLDLWDVVDSWVEKHTLFTQLLKKHPKKFISCIVDHDPQCWEDSVFPLLKELMKLRCDVYADPKDRDSMREALSGSLSFLQQEKREELIRYMVSSRVNRFPPDLEEITYVGPAPVPGHDFHKELLAYLEQSNSHGGIIDEFSIYKETGGAIIGCTPVELAGRVPMLRQEELLRTLSIDLIPGQIAWELVKEQPIKVVPAGIILGLENR